MISYPTSTETEAMKSLKTPPSPSALCPISPLIPRTRLPSPLGILPSALLPQGHYPVLTTQYLEQLLLGLPWPLLEFSPIFTESESDHSPHTVPPGFTITVRLSKGCF